MNIAAVIKDILIQSDHAVIPEIGRFSVEITPAILDPATGLLSPPSRQITFSSNSDSPDKGQLTEYISATYGIPLIKAEREIQLSVKAIKTALENNEKIIIDGIGTLQKKADGTLLYEQILSHDLNLESLGLKAIQLAVPPQPAPPPEPAPPVPPVPAETAKPVEIKPDPPKPPVQKKNDYTSAIVSGSILLILAVGAFIIFIIPKKQQPPAVEQPVITTPEPEYWAEDTTTEPIGEHNYFLITGSFRKEKNAIEYSRELTQQGFAAQVIPDLSLYRVVIGTFTNRDEAINELNNLRNRYGNDFVWMLTK